MQKLKDSEIQGRATFVSAPVADISGKRTKTKRGKISNGIIINGVPHHSDYMLTDSGAHVEVSFSLEMPANGKAYNTYSLFSLTPKGSKAPMFVFRTGDISKPFVFFNPKSMPPFPVYKAQQKSGKKVVVDIYRGVLNLSGCFDFFAAYAPVENLKNLLSETFYFRSEINTEYSE